MNIVDFRQLHSELIAEYQLVEEKLRFIYLYLDKYGFNLGLEFVEYWDSLNKELLDLIDKVREKRNFWCHQCYLKIAFRRNGESKLKDLEERMNSDMDDAKKLVLDLIGVIDRVEKYFGKK